MSLAGAVRWTLSSRIFTSIVSVGAPGMENSTISLSFSPSAYATVLGATLIRYSGILATSLVASKRYGPRFHFDHPRPRPLYTRARRVPRDFFIGPASSCETFNDVRIHTAL